MVLIEAVLQCSITCCAQAGPVVALVPLLCLNELRLTRFFIYEDD